MKKKVVEPLVIIGTNETLEGCIKSGRKGEHQSKAYTMLGLHK